MKTVKRILLGLVALIVLTLVVALFVPGEYTVERSAEIKRSKDDVFRYVKNIGNQRHYNAWLVTDPELDQQSRGEDGKVGFVCAWDSKMEEVGKGEQEISEIREGESVATELRFIKPFEGNASSMLHTEDAGMNGTKVKWSFHGKMPYPMNVMLVFADMDKFLGDKLQKGLENLKVILENEKEGMAENQAR